MQDSNAEDPILVTLFGIIILVKLSQDSNAEYPILVTLFGISIFVKLVQDSNAEDPILIPPVIITSFNDEGT